MSVKAARACESGTTGQLECSEASCPRRAQPSWQANHYLAKCVNKTKPLKFVSAFTKFQPTLNRPRRD